MNTLIAPTQHSPGEGLLISHNEIENAAPQDLVNGSPHSAQA
ncbi:hypothetical protein [Pseudomonas japonica]|nr:hypothetical protein [Pseudomonas japonica]